MLSEEERESIRRANSLDHQRAAQIAKDTKQHYTAHRIDEMLRAEGYQGSESRAGLFRAEWERCPSRAEVFLPPAGSTLSFTLCHEWGTTL
jgi:hypothetical protein